MVYSLYLFKYDSTLRATLARKMGTDVECHTLLRDVSAKFRAFING